MIPVSVQRRAQNLILFTVCSITLIVSPWLTIDAVNLPKFLILGTFSMTVVGTLAPYAKQISNSGARVTLNAVLFFIFSLVVVCFASGAGIWTQVYGTRGRNTGLITYICLSLLMVAVAFVSNPSFAKKLIWMLIATGATNTTYGLVQWLGFDPIKWSDIYGPIVGTLGNPNFTSAHLGIAGLAALPLIVDKACRLRVRLVLFTYLCLSLFVITKTNSSQGLLIFLLGATFVVYFRYFTTARALFRRAYCLLAASALIIGIFGLLNKGPLGFLLYQYTTAYRGDYWRAGWKMTIDNPMFGVGLDSYGDWYRFSRTEIAALRRGPDYISDSAHNVFLDISSNGGFFLLIGYLSILVLISYSGWRILRKLRDFDAIGVGLVVTWLAYICQSVVSINQLALATWGWIIGGTIVGYDLYKESTRASKVEIERTQSPGKVTAAVVLTSFMGCIAGFVVAMWPMSLDMNFRNALESGDALKIEAAAKQFPKSGYYLAFASQLFLENKLEDKALELATLSIESNPRHFNSWKSFVSNPKLSQSEKASAIAKMRELDPFNNTLGKK